MTYKEACGYMEDLQRILTQYRFMFSKELAEANGKAIKAVEKQIPKKPILKCEGIYINGSLQYLDDNERLCCPSCGNGAAGYNYCDYCGQRFDRGDDE